MSSYLINMRVCVIIAACVLFFISGLVIGSDVNNPANIHGSKEAAEINDSNGPTVTLSYGDQASEQNPFASFMYFVPLESLTLVDMETSADNEQKVRTVSYERKVTSKSFYVSCEFEMLGDGFHKYTFDHAQMIAIRAAELKQGETLTHILDYIKFDGAGLGRIEVKGTISGSTQTVTEVDQHFTARGRKSPVTMGLYDVKPKNGQYKYENRTNELVARVDTFTFRKSVDEPRIEIKLASIDAATKPNGLLAGIKGAIANLFINPPKVAKLGNDTMLNFGLTLLNKKPSFTFPKAENIRGTRIVTANNQ